MDRIVPLVKRGFWETTDNGRIHRLRVIESICGGAENEFYLGLLKRAKKELRQRLSMPSGLIRKTQACC